VNIKPVIQWIPKSAKFAILVVLVAKVLVLVTAYLTTYLYKGASPPFTILSDMLNRWDAPHYIDIAKNGYVNIGDQANYIVFFPLYPLLVRVATFDFSFIDFTALVVSNVCSLIAFYYLYKLTQHEFSDSAAVKAVLFLSVFPTAYFLSAPYTEGLFFALLIACTYYARLGKWGLAGSLAFLGALTRMAGLLLLPVLLVEYFYQTGWHPKKIKPNILWTLLPIEGFLLYLAINKQITGNPFTFITVESTHWFNRFDPVTGLVGAYNWATKTDYPGNITIGAAPIVFAVLGLIILGVAVWRRLRPSYVLYLFLAWGLAVSTSWWVSVPRYVMAMFPMFMLLAELVKKKSVIVTAVIVSGAFLCYFTVLFSIGYWAF
jgi:hypothetical protein